MRFSVPSISRSSLPSLYCVACRMAYVVLCCMPHGLCGTALHAACVLYCVACRMAHVVLCCMPHGACCTALHAACMLYCVACRIYVVLGCMPHGACCTVLHAAWRMLCCVACRIYVVLGCMPHGACCAVLHKAATSVTTLTRSGRSRPRCPGAAHAQERPQLGSQHASRSAGCTSVWTAQALWLGRQTAEAAHRHGRLGLAWLDKVKERPLLYLVWVTEQVASEF